jgi:hypothetical protein
MPANDIRRPGTITIAPALPMDVPFFAVFSPDTSLLFVVSVKLFGFLS